MKLDEKAIKWITREKGKGTPTREIAKIERITIEELIGSVSTTKKQEKFLGQARL